MGIYFTVSSVKECIGGHGYSANDFYIVGMMQTVLQCLFLRLNMTLNYKIKIVY